MMSILLVVSIVHPSSAFAENKRSLQDESIYDLLVDRFHDGNLHNDEDVDVKDMYAFSGGDFAGISEKVDYIANMGFTLASIGPVFKTATYDGNQVLNYEEFDPHFGTEEEFIDMIKVLHEKNIGTIIDFPMNGISDTHVWIQDGTLESIPTGEGTASWVTTDDKVKETLKEAILSFAKKYDVAGIRLTHIGNFDESYLNEIITEAKEINQGLYILSNEPSTAQFDLAPQIEKMNALKQAYVQVDPDSAPLNLFEDENATDLIQLDELTGPRFTYEMTQLRMFPPTRWKIAATALFTLPGVPMMPYESEIAITGKEAPETHPIVNFKTDTELYDHIADLNKLRNQSETLRNGEFEMLHNENGFTVFTRTSDEETWLIVINNTSEVANLEIDEEKIGENKRLRGLLEADSVRQSKDGKYRVVLERELAEVYIADEDKGYNTPYLIASILVYTLFFALLFTIFRRGKKNKEASK